MGQNWAKKQGARMGSAVRARRGRGYALSELLLAVAVFAVLAAAAGSGYMYMKRTALAQDHALKLVNLVNETRRAYRPLASFSTISGSGLYKMGLVQKPMYSDGTNVYDAWANQMTFAGADTYFAFLTGWQRCDDGAGVHGGCHGHSGWCVRGADRICCGAGDGCICRAYHGGQCLQDSGRHLRWRRTAGRVF